MCHECAPEAWHYRCTACTEYKPASAFNHSRTDLETAFHTRCKTCETCTACKRRFSDHRSLAPDTKLCAKCLAQEKLKPCTVCQVKRPPHLYSASQWRQAARQSRHLYLRCIPCHTCATCQEPKDEIPFPPLSSECWQCSKKKPCSV